MNKFWVEPPPATNRLAWGETTVEIGTGVIASIGMKLSNYSMVVKM